MRDFLKKLPIIVLTVFLIFILFGALFYKSEFSMITYGDRAVLLNQNILILFLGLSIYTISFVLFWIVAEKLKPKGILINLWLVILISAVFQLLIIYYFRIKLTADWRVIYDISKALAINDLSSLNKGGYLFAYPNNLGLTLYFMVINLFSGNNLYVLRLLNIIWTLITLVILNKMFIRLFPDDKEEKTRFLIFSFLFLPTIFMSNLVYNEVFSAMLFLISTYEAIKFSQEQKVIDLILIVIILSVANFVRGIGLLFFIPFLIYFYVMKTNWQRILIFTVLTIIGFSIPMYLFNLKYYSAGKISEPLGRNSVPISKWIHIGLNKKYFGYWDQGESYWMYANEADWNKKTANNIFITDIKKRINQYGGIGLSEIFFKKLIWLWSEGTYQSIYLGMSHSNPGGYITETRVSRLFDENEKLRDIFKLPMYFANLFSLITISIFLFLVILKRKWDLVGNEFVAVVIFLSFILFYLLWEVKPRYLYPMFPYILLLTYVYFFRLTKMMDDNKFRITLYKHLLKP